MNEPITYRCGCANKVHVKSGVLRSMVKCDKHQAMRRDPAALGFDYYKELGVFVDGIPNQGRHVAQIQETLGAFPAYGARVLEIGCGVSSYAAALKTLDCHYTGIDPSPWVVRWMNAVYPDSALCLAFEQFDEMGVGLFDMVLAAHSFEHMADAPMMIDKAASMLVPDGQLWVIVPDDTDPCNPDHLWFFTPDTLRSCLESAGLTVDRLEIRRHVPQENFLYVRARKS